eukprot:scaffold284378_cov31-Tisochrysis_lutea.AAC.2
MTPGGRAVAAPGDGAGTVEGGVGGTVGGVERGGIVCVEHSRAGGGESDGGRGGFVGKMHDGELANCTALGGGPTTSFSDTPEARRS